MKFLFSSFVIVGLLCGEATAQVPDSTYEQALGTVVRFAKEMTVVVPCLYTAAPLAKDKPDPVEDTWGTVEFKNVLGRFASTGASPAQIDALNKAFAENYRPKWAVDDIRAFARFCQESKIIDDAARLSGQGAPLMLRDPFRAK